MGSTSFFQRKAEAYALRKSIRTAASSGQQQDWDLVDEGLWLAAQQAEPAAANGDLPGVTHILQVAAEVSPSYPECFTYCHIPALDLEQQELIGVLPTCVPFIHNAREQGGCVLVHCMAGVSRSAAVVLGYWMWRDRLGLQAALARLRAARPCCNPHQGFLLQLQLFEERGFTWDGWEPWNLQRFLDARAALLTNKHQQGPGLVRIRGILDGTVDGIEGVAASPRLGRTSSDVPDYRLECSQQPGGTRSGGGAGSSCDSSKRGAGGGEHGSSSGGGTRAVHCNSNMGGAGGGGHGNSIMAAGGGEHCSSSGGDAGVEQMQGPGTLQQVQGGAHDVSSAAPAAAVNGAAAHAQQHVLPAKAPSKAAGPRQQGSKPGHSPGKPPLHPGTVGAAVPSAPAPLPPPVLLTSRPVLPHRTHHNRLSGPGTASASYIGNTLASITAGGTTAASGKSEGSTGQFTLPSRFPSAHQLSRPTFSEFVQPPPQHTMCMSSTTAPVCSSVPATAFGAVQGGPSSTASAVHLPAPLLPLPGVVPLLHARSAQLHPVLSASLDTLSAGLHDSYGGARGALSNPGGALGASFGALSNEEVMCLAADLMAAAAGQQPPEEAGMQGSMSPAAQNVSSMPLPHTFNMATSGMSSSSWTAAGVLPPELGWNGRPPVRLRRAGSGLPVGMPMPTQAMEAGAGPRPLSAASATQQVQVQPGSSGTLQVQAAASHTLQVQSAGGNTLQVHAPAPQSEAVVGKPPWHRVQQHPPQQARKPAWPAEVLHNAEVFHLPPIVPTAPPEAATAVTAAGNVPSASTHHHQHHKQAIAGVRASEPQALGSNAAAAQAGLTLPRGARSHINIPPLPSPASPRLPLIATLAGSGGGGSGPNTPVHHAADQEVHSNQQQPQQVDAGKQSSAKWAASRSHLHGKSGHTCVTHNNMSDQSHLCDRDMVEYLLSMALTCTAAEEAETAGLLPQPLAPSSEEQQGAPGQQMGAGGSNATAPAESRPYTGTDEVHGGLHGRQPEGVTMAPPHHPPQSPHRPSAQALLLRALSHSSSLAVRHAFNEQARLFSAAYLSPEEDTNPEALALQLMAAVQGGQLSSQEARVAGSQAAVQCHQTRPVQGRQLQPVQPVHQSHMPPLETPAITSASDSTTCPRPAVAADQQGGQQQQPEQHPGQLCVGHDQLSPPQQQQPEEHTGQLSPASHSLTMIRARRFWEGLVSSVGGADLLQALQEPLEAAALLVVQDQFQHHHQHHHHQQQQQQTQGVCDLHPPLHHRASGWHQSITAQQQQQQQLQLPSPHYGDTGWQQRSLDADTRNPVLSTTDDSSPPQQGSQTGSYQRVAAAAGVPPIAVIHPVTTPPAVTSRSHPAGATSRHMHQQLHYQHQPAGGRGVTAITGASVAEEAPAVVSENQADLHGGGGLDLHHDPYTQHQPLHDGYHTHHQHAASAPDSPAADFSRSRSATEPAQRTTRHSPAGSQGVTLTQAMVRAFEATFGPQNGVAAAARNVRSMSGANGGAGQGVGGGSTAHGVLDPRESWAGYTNVTGSTAWARQGSSTRPSSAASGTVLGAPGSTMGSRTPSMLDARSMMSMHTAGRYSFSRAGKGAGMGLPGATAAGGYDAGDALETEYLEGGRDGSVTYGNDVSQRSSDQPHDTITPSSGLSPAGTTDPATLTGPQSSLSWRSSLFSDLGASTAAPPGMGCPGSTVGVGGGTGSGIPSLAISGGVARTPSAMSTFSLASSRASGSTGHSMYRTAAVHQPPSSTAGEGGTGLGPALRSTSASAGKQGLVISSSSKAHASVSPFYHGYSRLSRRFTDEVAAVTPAAAPVTLHQPAGSEPLPEQDTTDSAV